MLNKKGVVLNLTKTLEDEAITSYSDTFNCPKERNRVSAVNS